MILRVTGEAPSREERELFVRTANSALSQGSAQFVGWVRAQVFSMDMKRAGDKDHFSRVYRKVRAFVHPDKQIDPDMKQMATVIFKAPDAHYNDYQPLAGLVSGQADLWSEYGSSNAPASAPAAPRHAEENPPPPPPGSESGAGPGVLPPPPTTAPSSQRKLDYYWSAVRQQSGIVEYIPGPFGEPPIPMTSYRSGNKNWYRKPVAVFRNPPTTRTLACESLMTLLTRGSAAFRRASRACSTISTPRPTTTRGGPLRSLGT